MTLEFGGPVQKMRRRIMMLSSLVAVLISIGIFFGARAYLKNRENIELMRRNEINRIEEIGKQNEVLKKDILALIEKWKLEEARDKKREIESGIESISYIIENSRVGTKDINNIVRIWGLELEDTRKKIDEAENEFDQYVEDIAEKFSLGLTFDDDYNGIISAKRGNLGEAKDLLGENKKALVILNRLRKTAEDPNIKKNSGILYLYFKYWKYLHGFYEFKKEREDGLSIYIEDLFEGLKSEFIEVRLVSIDMLSRKIKDFKEVIEPRHIEYLEEALLNEKYGIVQDQIEMTVNMIKENIGTKTLEHNKAVEATVE